LLGVTFVPFPTAVLAEYIRGDAQYIAAAFYSGTYVGLAIVFNLLWRHAAHRNRLLGHRADPHLVEAITRGYSFGPPLYLFAFVLAFVCAEASAAMNLGLAVFWALPSQNPLVRRKTPG